MAITHKCECPSLFLLLILAAVEGLEAEWEGWRRTLGSGGGGSESAGRRRDPRITAKDKKHK